MIDEMFVSVPNKSSISSFIESLNYVSPASVGSVETPFLPN